MLDVARIGKLLPLLRCMNGTLRRQASDALVDVCRSAVDAREEDDEFEATVAQIATLLLQLVDTVHGRLWPCRTSAAGTICQCLKLLIEHRDDASDKPLPLAEIDAKHISAIVTPLYAQDLAEMNKEMRGPQLMSARQQRHQMNRMVDMEERTGVSTKSFVGDDEFVKSASSSPSTSSVGGEQRTIALMSKADAVKIIRSAKSLGDLHQAVIDLLQCTLLAHDWEFRHGSALTLMSCINEDLCPSSFVMDTLHTSLHTLCADRFTDFSTATCIAPVRETCSQLVAICVLNARRRGRKDTTEVDEWVMNMLDVLCDYESDWEVRQSGLLCIKYVGASLSTSPTSLALFNHMMSKLTKLLTPATSRDEISSATAAQAINALLVDEAHCDAEVFGGVRRVAVTAIEWYANNASNDHNVMDTAGILAELLRVVGHSKHDPSPPRVDHVLPPSFPSTLQRLFAHDDGNVRRMAIRCATALNAKSATLIVSTYVRLLIDGTDDGEVLEEIIHLVADRAVDSAIGAESFVWTVIDMLNCSIVDSNNPIIDATTLHKLRDEHGIGGATASTDVYMCGDDVRGLDAEARTKIVSNRQSYCARFITTLLYRMHELNCNLSLLLDWLSTAVQSNRSTIRFQALLMLYTIRTHCNGKQETMPASLRPAVELCLAQLASAANPIFEETTLLYAHVSRMCADFVTKCTLVAPKCSPPPMSITKLEEAVASCEKLLVDVNLELKRQRATYKELYEDLQALKTYASTVTQLVTPLHARMHAMLASIIALYIDQSPPTTKLTPIIKPIVTTLSTEAMPICVRVYGAALGRIARHTIDKTPGPLPKVMWNVASLLTGEAEEEHDCGTMLTPKPDNRRFANVCTVLDDLFGTCPASMHGVLFDFVMGREGEEGVDQLTTKAYFAYAVARNIDGYTDLIHKTLPTLLHRSTPHMTAPKLRHAIARLLSTCCETVDVRRLIDTLLTANDCNLLGVVKSECDDDEGHRSMVGLLLEWLHRTLTGKETHIMADFASLFLPFALSHISHEYPAYRRAANEAFAQLVVLCALKGDRSATTPESYKMDDRLLKMQEENNHMVDLLASPDRLPRIDVSSLGIRDGVELRPYQVDGVTWLAFLHRYRLHGILCDDMGLGKTLQTLTVIAHSLTVRAGGGATVSLIVCPRTLIGHWVHECAAYFPNNAHIRPMAVEKAQDLQTIKTNKATIVVTSYEMIRRHVAQFCGDRQFHYAVLDEGHIIRNSKSALFKAVCQIKARHRLILSGTPVQNNVTDLWTLMHWLMPSYLGTQTEFNASFARPILAARDVKTDSSVAAAGDKQLNTLHKMVLPFTLRRLKEDVLKELPDKIISDVMCDMSIVQREMYDRVTDRVLGSKERVSPLQVLTYIRKLCNHPYLVDDSSPYSISLSGKMLALQELLVECGIVSRREGDTDDEGEEGNDRNAVNDGGGHRALIFCQYKSTLNLLALYFDGDDGDASMSGVKYLRLDGSVPAGQRHNTAQRFNKDTSFNVLLLTTQIGGVGLNLTGADTVIMMEHDFNPARDMQAIDRAHRLGQRRTVNVYRLITRDTIEEKVMRLQRSKTREAGIIIGTDNTSLTSMATEQLFDLLTTSSTADGAPSKKRAKRADGTKEGEEKEGMEEMWEASYDYEDAFDVRAFVKQINN